MRLKPLCWTVLACCALPCLDASAADWLQWGYDAAHSSHNPDETRINASNVAQLTRRYQVAMPASIDSAPVYRSNVVTPQGTKNLLFALSQSGRLMAIDAANGSEVWFKTTTGKQPTASSPAVDPGGEYVYSYGIDGKVHKYQIGDGTEITTGGWPQIATLKIDVEKGQSGLAIARSRGTNWLYMANNGYVGDGGDYQGHLTTINLDTGTQNVFNTLCSNLTMHFVPNGTPGVNNCGTRMSGIWGRGGAVYHAGTDRVFITTGNGNFNANTGGFNWGDSVLALNPDGTGSGGGLPVDSYTPTTYASLDSQDKDLGSVSLLVLPTPAGSTIEHIGLQTGKDSKLHLINLANMSGTGAPGRVGGELQSPTPNVPQGGPVTYSQPAAWVDANGATWAFVSNGSGISGLKVCFNSTCTATSGTPMLVSQWTKTGSSTAPIIANGVLYHAGTCSGRCVVARDPATGNQLWTSEAIGTVKWGSPILVNGTLYMMDTSAKLWAWELPTAPDTHTVTPLAGPNGSLAPATPQTVNDGATTSFTVTPSANYRIAAVTGCGGSLVGNTYTTAPVVADCTVNATFAPLTYTVTPAAGPNGGIAPATPQTVDHGAQTSFTLTPDAHYRIGTASGCGGSLSGLVYTTGPVTANCTVNATFVRLTHTVTPQASGGGMIAPGSPQTIDDGVTASFTLTPDAGHVIGSVTGCGGSLAGSIYTTAPVTQDCSVSAVFALDASDVIFKDGFDGPSR